MKIYKYISILCVGFLLYTSCTKEQLQIVNKGVKLDENSAEYQDYLRERTVDYLNNYMFTKASDAIRLITDNAVKEEMQALYASKKLEAETKAFKLVRDSNGDTLYFRIKDTVGTKTITMLCNRNIGGGYVENYPGQLYGIKNYAAVTSLTLQHARFTEVKELEYATNLTSFNFTRLDPNDFPTYYPNDQFAIDPLKFDLSKNDKLTSVSVTLSDISGLTASQLPQHDNCALSFSRCYFNANDNHNDFHGKSLAYDGWSYRTEFIFTNKDINSLTLSYSSISVRDLPHSNSNLRKIDVSESNLAALSLSNHSELKELTIGDQPALTTLKIVDCPLPAGFADFDASAYPVKALTLTNNPNLQKLTVGEGLTNFIVTNNENLTEIVLPENFSISQFLRPGSTTYLNVIIRRDCNIVNKPDWLDSYIKYID
ncbi:MAG: hypothetical protein QM594_11250 [Niabella sp.]